ncbi:MAG TPA: anaerobic ribonucleoside-triphosphate reductase activating protein [archaeon]|nr:anaerobic ribonucleoside-triphosphate reductase activating protein [archaeon]
MALIFKGIQKTTLIDFPRQIACTLFLPNCNFKCGYCYNTALVENKDTGVSISEQQALAFLEERKRFLDGVCLTGGEPTLCRELPAFCAKVKQKGFLVKIDTNGTNPEMLKELIEKRLVDFIAMDIKAPLEKYPLFANAPVDLKKIKQSIGIIKKSGLEYEFRTTVVPALSEEDILEIARLLKGAKKFVLQQFQNSMPLLDKNLEKQQPHSPEELKKFSEKIKGFFEKTEIRGI